MSKFCPIVNRKVVYLDCLECENKVCKTKNFQVNKHPSDILFTEKGKKEPSSEEEGNMQM